MVPVRLQLKNFMSYGTEAPPLDFDQFEVACLSGRNGQGKSALLDAMTWALWGEARKASSNRKPDADLLRIGAQEMRVELTFDVEGERYRVERSYRDRGATTKPGLELQTLNPQTHEYNTLSEGGIRETQAAIDNVLGLSYDTFINSAFLLQGRSDEFTKKRPSQRKEILANVLDLGHYEKLAERARAHRREAKTNEEQAARDVERLEAALEKESEWKAEYQKIGDQLAEKKETLRSLRKREDELSRKLVKMENKADKKESLQASSEQLQQRLTESKEDVAALSERIVEAEELEQRSDQIEAAFERFRELREERNELDTQRELHRGLEKQIQQKENERRARQGKLENEIHRRQNDVERLEERLEEIQEQLKGREKVEEKLKKAQAARDELKDMKAVREKRERLRERQQEVKEAILSKRDSLKGRLETVEESIESEGEQLADPEALQKKKAALDEQQTEREALEEKAASVKQKGQSLSEALREREGTVEALERDHEEQESQYAAFQKNTDDVCPTCGTELTPRHRREVEEHFKDELHRLRASIAEHRDWITEHKDERDALRERYQEVQGKLEVSGNLAEERAALQEQIQATRKKLEALGERQQQAEKLRRRIKNKNFAQEQRERWRSLKQQKAELSFDEERFSKLQHAAAQVERYEEQHQEIEQAAARRKPVRQKLDAKREMLRQKRRQLDDGAAFDDLDERLSTLREQLGQVDFNPERFQAVRSKLGELDEAAAHREKLINTRENLSDWRERRQRARDQMASAREERESVEQRLQQIEEALKEKPDVKQKRDAVTEERKQTEETLNELSSRKGKLEGKLEGANEKRKRLEEHHEKRQEAKAERNLYSHLNDAFGKHGIPSLIIEQTIPEVEERANELLGRLTEGCMNVRLETLGKKKTGGTKETLDIIISDEQGVARPYETYSGGESFRVNFALRVALSQLLAERSGVRIRTLVVDEGFGTQDNEGVQNLVEAIQTVQDDFTKILVITHLKDLKEAFPVRIEVEKDPLSGSDFDLIGV